MFRFANLVEKSANMGEIWNAVRNIRSETVTSQFICQSNHLLNEQVSQVKAVEQLLGIESSEQPIYNISNKILKSSADPFMYLAVCPGEYNAWAKFYKDLFGRESPHQILLSLNRIMKKTNIKKGTLRNVARNSFREVTKALKQNIPREKTNLNFQDTNSFDLKGKRKK